MPDDYSKPAPQPAQAQSRSESLGKPGASEQNSEAQRQQAAREQERRKIGLIVHDDRGNARVEWRPAPAGSERVSLEIVEETERRAESGYNPYSTVGGESYTSTGTWVGKAAASAGFPKAGAIPGVAKSDRGTGNTTRTDLRKLSEHIKQMRALQARKAKEEEG